jgi:hypothetical protein
MSDSLVDRFDVLVDRYFPYLTYPASTVLSSPTAFIGQLYDLGEELNVLYHERLGAGDGVYVLAEDWDDLLLLDACRYDVFEEVIADRDDYDGTLESRTSRGSQSLEFMRANFEGRQCHDVVYVSGNPYIDRIPDGTFHDVVHVWQDEWDDETESLLPATVTDAAIEAHERYPDKRLVVHYMQPHVPFIGETGMRYRREYGIAGHSQLRQAFDDDVYPLYQAMQFGFSDISRGEALEAYRENLELVLDSVYRFLDTVEGRTVISADHGDLFGERESPIPVRGYGHPDGLRHPLLNEVPWYVIEGKRRDVRPEDPVEQDATDEETVRGRLRDLGYRE